MEKLGGDEKELSFEGLGLKLNSAEDAKGWILYALIESYFKPVSLFLKLNKKKRIVDTYCQFFLLRKKVGCFGLWESLPKKTTSLLRFQ